ncbi:MAG TPA: dihydrofolate reductase family protein [Actinomycetaceae bacterium]|nr:dihydrofolate reductase family protein [Actinomycetaceae bacterium]
MTQPRHGAVLWHATASLDGYIATPGDDVSWVFDYVNPADPGAEGVGERVGAVLAGRRSFEAGRRDGRDVLDGAWAGPKYLLTHRPVDGLPDGVALRSGDVGPVVEEARRAADGKDVLLIGADVARQCLAAGLVHEVVLHVAPVLLADGVRFRGPAGRTDLRLVDVGRHGELVTLRYRTSLHSLEN